MKFLKGKLPARRNVSRRLPLSVCRSSVVSATDFALDALNRQWNHVR